MDFFAIRYFIVQSSLTLFPIKDNLKPKDLFIQPILERKETKYYSKIYTTRLFNTNDISKYIIGYFLKSLATHLIELEQELFIEQDIQNWEKLFFIIDTEKQLIVVEHNTNVATPDNVLNVLYQLISKSIRVYGYDLKLDFLVDKFAFWEIINDSEGLYQIAFDLNAPNLFGGSKKANSWLKTLKEKHNMTKVAVDFRNENGDLKYDEEELESYRDYADSGGGNWTLGVIEKGRKKKYVSSNHLRKKEADLNTDDPQHVLQNLKTIREKLKGLINSIDNFGS